MPQQGSSWVVSGGDNVFKIAEQVYGNQRMAFEILKMNGGNTVIQPGDVLSLPEWNDPNVYVGANQMQNVLNQRVANDPNYTGPTVAAVPVSQQAGWGAAQGLTPTGTQQAGGAQGGTAVQGPNTPTNPYQVQRSFREADVMAGLPRQNAGLMQMRGPQPFATPGMTKPVANTEVARAQRYQASGVPGSALATQKQTQSTQSPLSTSPIAMAGGNIGSLFSSLIGKNMKPQSNKLVNPLYSVLAEKLAGQTGTPAAGNKRTPSTGEHQKAFALEVQNFQTYISSAGTTKPLPYVSGAAASNVLGYDFAKKMNALGYVYDPQTRRFTLVTLPTTSNDISGLPKSPTSFQGFGEDWNQSHYPQVSFEPGIDRGGGGTGGGVTGRAASNTAGYVALSTRVATG